VQRLWERATSSQHCLIGDIKSNANSIGKYTNPFEHNYRPSTPRTQSKRLEHNSNTSRMHSRTRSNTLEQPRTQFEHIPENSPNTLEHKSNTFLNTTRTPLNTIRTHSRTHSNTIRTHSRTHSNTIRTQPEHIPEHTRTHFEHAHSCGSGCLLTPLH
jgi:hypothetical protein